ncbi:hypothetical protein F5Y11DRAFT_332101 [Daldinia sp. FL1419]|nr:hypothetical protein F5Y11DRAFT_332101 [Daldinia sp. FL1419]
MKVGFVSNNKTIQDGKCHWSRILTSGELKSNLSSDTTSKAQLNIRRYIQEVFSVQDTRRFVIAFTLYGPLIRLFVFDHLGESRLTSSI